MARFVAKNCGLAFVPTQLELFPEESEVTYVEWELLPFSFETLVIPLSQTGQSSDWSAD